MTQKSRACPSRARSFSSAAGSPSPRSGAGGDTRRPSRLRLLHLSGAAAVALVLSTCFAVLQAGSIATVSPAAASTLLTIGITGSGFNAAPASNEVTFAPATGPVVTATPSASAALPGTEGLRRLTVTIPASIPVGRASLQVRNLQTGEVSAGGAIEVIRISLPDIRSAAPGAAGIGVRVDGSPNTNFVSGSTKVSFGAGISVSSIVVHSPNSLTATIAVAQTAALGSRHVALSGSQLAIAMNAFSVAAAEPNQPPVARPGQSYSGIAGQPLAFDGSLSSDPDPNDAIASYAWLFGDGTSGTGATPTHTYSSAGSFTASLTVRDGRGAEHTATVPVTIAAANRAPIASPGGPYTGTAGQPVAFDGSASSDPDAGDGVTSYNWLFGDGTSATGATPSHAYASAGTFTASLTVRDGHEAVHTTTVSVTIQPANTVPVADAGGPYNGTAGQSIPFDASQSDDADDDQLTFEWTFGDGGVATGASPAHAYLTAGTFVGALTVTDGRGGSATDTFEVHVTPAPLGRGALTGRVYDDVSGLPLANATVQLMTVDGRPADALPVSSDSLGRYRLSTAPGPARVRVTKDGFTSADLQADVIDGRRTDPDDARLTALNAGVAVVSAVAGGTVASAGGARLTVSPGTLAQDRTMRVTDVSAQGPVRRLPLGWTPLALVDINGGGSVPFGSLAALTVHLPAMPPPDRGVTVALWSEVAGAWLSVGSASRTPDGSALEAAIPQPGQYAFAVEDFPPDNPPLPGTGSPLTGVALRAPPPDVQLTLSPSPRVLFAQPGARSTVTGTTIPSVPLPSGTTLVIDLAETLTYANGSTLKPWPARRRLALHRSTGNTSVATFLVGPSRPLAPFSLREGAIDLAGRVPLDPGAPRGRVLGAAGGEFTAAGGDRVVVPAGSAAEDLPLDLFALPAEEFPLDVPDGATLLRSLDFDLHGTLLTRDVVLSAPSPEPLPAGSVAAVVQLVDIGDATRMALVAMAERSPGALITTVDPIGDSSIDLPGVKSEGRYAFLRLDGTFVFVAGVLTASGLPIPGALVEAEGLPIAAVTDASGRFVLLVPPGQQSFRVSNPANGDQTVFDLTLEPGVNVTDRSVSIGPSPPSVVSISPVDGANSVALGAGVRVTFSEPVDPATIQGSAALSTGGVAVAGALSLAPGNSVLTFLPAALLQSDAQYQFSIAATVRDLAGHAMAAPFTASFRTVDITPPVVPTAGTILASIPDASGNSTITGAPGTADPGGVVIVRNLRTNALTTLTPNADGSFSGLVTALRSDRLEITIRDGAGNAITLPVAAFRGVDGSVVVGAAGGRVEGPGGVVAAIPPGALPDGTVVRIEAATSADFTLAAPAAFPFVGGVTLNLGGVTPSLPIDLSIDAPADATPQDQVLVARVVRLPRRQGWTIADRAHLSDGRYTTASPPFEGAINETSYAFLRPGPGGCISYVNVTYSYGLTAMFLSVSAPTWPIVLPFVFPTGGVGSTVLPALCDHQFDIQVVNADTEVVLQTISQRAPVLANAIFVPQTPITDDSGAPTVVWSNVLSGSQIGQVEVLFSEKMDPQSVIESLRVEDAFGHPAPGNVTLLRDDTLAIFRPQVQFRMGENYSLILAGSQDQAGNLLQTDAIIFNLFGPRELSQFENVPAIADALRKCTATTCTTSGADVAYLGGTLFIANGVRSTDEQYVDPATPKRLVAIDVSQPDQPRLIGFHTTATNPRALAAVTAARFTVPGGVLFAGDLLLVAGGGRVPGGELAGKLEIYDVSACTARPLGPGNCLDPALQPFKGHKLLSTPLGVPPRTGVPQEAGVPLQIAALHSRTIDGTTVGLGAYTSVVPVGIESVDVTQAFNIPPGADEDLAPDGLLRGNFLDVGILKDRVVAVENDPSQGGFFLAVLGANLSRIVRLNLPGPAARVGPLENLVLDIDGDGRVGTAEQNDDDAVTGTAELFDLAVVSSGPLSENCASTVPCGELYIIDLSSQTALAHSGAPSLLARIPLPGAPFSVVTDAEARIAYVELRGHGLAIVDLSNLTSGLIDADGNGRDDRLLAIVAQPDIIQGKIKIDLTRGVAYTNGATTGTRATCVNDAKCLDVSLRSVSLDALTYQSADRTSATVFITAERWAASDMLCAALDLRLIGSVAINYLVNEVPQQLQAMLDLAMAGSGTLNQADPQICIPTRSEVAFPLQSYVTIDFFETATQRRLKKLLIHLAPQILTVQPPRIQTSLDRINGTVCAAGDTLLFTLSQSASVTIRINGNIVLSAFPGVAGINHFPITTTMAPPGETPFEVIATFAGSSPPAVTTVSGFILHDVITTERLPVGHTLIRGVNLFDGQLAVNREDLMVPGLGPGLQFTRGYGSAGTSSGGPMGAGWSHNYDSRLVLDECGVVTVIGAEGSGMRFHSPTPVGDEIHYRPQAGYHGRLVYHTADDSYDYFTKDRTRYHYRYGPTAGSDPSLRYRLDFIEDPHGNRTTLEYAPGIPFNLQRVVDASARRLVLTYAPFGVVPEDRIVGVSLEGASGPLGVAIEFQYDEFGNLVRAARAARIETYVYTSGDVRDRHNLLRVTDPNGNVTEYGYFADADVFPGEGQFHSFVNKYDFVRHVIDAPGAPEEARTRFSYNYSQAPLTTVTSVIDVKNRTSVYTMGRFGQVNATADPLGQITRRCWAFEVCGEGDTPVNDVFVKSITEPNARVTRFAYDTNGNMSREEIDLTGMTGYESVVGPGGAAVDQVVTEYVYDPTFNKMTRKVDALGNVTEYSLNARGSVETMTISPSPGQTLTTTYTYYPNGLLHTIVDPRGLVTEHAEHDIYGNVTRVVDSGGIEIASTYDAQSRLTASSDTMGRSATMSYDTFGSVISRVRVSGSDSADRVETFEYLPNGQLLAETNGLGRRIEYTYDDLGRLVTQRETLPDPSGSPVVIQGTYAVDFATNTTTETDGRAVSTTTHFDSLDRPSEIFVGGPFGPEKRLALNAYDSVGNKISEQSLTGGVTTYAYDGLYRMVRKTLPTSTGSQPHTVRATYDLVGNVLSESDPNGNITVYAYDGIYRRISRTDPRGQQISYSYDESGNLLTENRITRGLRLDFTYDNRNRATSLSRSFADPVTGQPITSTSAVTFDDASRRRVLTDDVGHQVEQVFDGLDQLTGMTRDPAGLHLTTQFRYDANGNLSSVIDPAGRTQISEYDARNRRLRRQLLPQNFVEQFAYDGGDNLVSQGTRRGITNEYRYDNLNRPLQYILYESLTGSGQPRTIRQFSYVDESAQGPQMVETDANGNTTLHVYDVLGREVRTDDALGRTVRMEYDGVNRTAVIDQNDRRFEFAYDALNRQILERDPLGQTWAIEYLDALNRRVTTNKRGIRTLQQYDPLGRLRQVRQSLQAPSAFDLPVETHIFNADGTVAESINANGTRRGFVYDALGRLVSETAGLGSALPSTTTYQYDAASRLTGIREPGVAADALTIGYLYDDAARQVITLDALGHTTTTVYDGDQNPVTTQHPTGGQTQFAYDEIGKLLNVTDPLSRTTQYEYDPNRNRVAQVDARGGRVTLGYDALNRLTEVVQIGESTTHRTQYGYDNAGNLSLTIDPKNQRTEFTYDELNRVALRRHLNPADPEIRPRLLNVTFGYDPEGNLLSVQETKQVAPTGDPIVEATTRAYDNLDRLVQSTNYDGKRIANEYDAVGNRRSVTDPDGLTTSYAFDALSRLQRVTAGEGQTVYGYWPNGLQRFVFYPNGAGMQMDYDVAGQLTDLRHVLVFPGPDGARGTEDDSFSLIARYQYFYDANGNRTSQVVQNPAAGAQTTETTSYTYDLADQLTGVDYPGPAAVAYTYDLAGNRLTESGIEPSDGTTPLSRSYAYDRLNRLTSIFEAEDPTPHTTFEYDANGNLVRRVTGTNALTYSFDPLDRLARATVAGGDLIFDYDYNGLRVKKTSALGETRYLNDEGTLLQEYGAGSGLPTRLSYTYGSDLISLRDEAFPADNPVRSQFYLRDGLGSVTRLSSSSPAIVAEYAYDVWGNVLAQTGASSNSRGFTGHVRDTETGLQYFGARYYDPSIGRFLSQDPYMGDATNPPSLHRYQYAHGNPTRFVDLSGYAAEEIAEDQKKKSFLGTMKATGKEFLKWAEENVHETLASGVDLFYSAIESSMPPDLRARAHEMGMNRAESQVGQALQSGTPLSTIVVEQAKSLVNAPVELVKTLADPDATDQDVAKALVNTIDTAAVLVTGVKGGLRIGRGVARAAKEGLETVDRARITFDLLHYRRQSTGVVRFDSLITRGLGSGAEMGTVKVSGKFSLGDAWKLAGACVKASECIVSGGLTSPSLKNVFSNLLAEKSLGHGGYDPVKGKLRGDLDFHVRKPGQPYFYDTALASKFNRDVANLFDESDMHGVMGMDIPPDVLGARTTGGNALRASYLMDRIHSEAPHFISKNGNVRTDLYLRHGLPMSADVANWLSKGKVTKEGRYALIFKHGTEPMLRPINPDLATYRAIPTLNLPALNRLDIAFQPVPLKLGLLPFLGVADQDDPPGGRR